MAFLLPVSWDGRGGCEAYDIVHAAFPLRTHREYQLKGIAQPVGYAVQTFLNILS